MLLWCSDVELRYFFVMPEWFAWISSVSRNTAAWGMVNTVRLAARDGMSSPVWRSPMRLYIFPFSSGSTLGVHSQEPRPSLRSFDNQRHRDYCWCCCEPVSMIMRWSSLALSMMELSTFWYAPTFERIACRQIEKWQTPEKNKRKAYSPSALPLLTRSFTCGRPPCDRDRPGEPKWTFTPHPTFLNSPDPLLGLVCSGVWYVRPV